MEHSNQQIHNADYDIDLQKQEFDRKITAMDEMRNMLYKDIENVSKTFQESPKEENDR